MLARTNTALVDTVRYAETILSTAPLCREQLLLDSMVVEGTCPDRSRVKQLQIYHARHQLSINFPGTCNVWHEPSQSGSTLDGFGSRDLQVSAEAKLSIQLFHSISCSPRTIFEYWKDLLSVTSKASVFSGAIFRHLLSKHALSAVDFH